MTSFGVGPVLGTSFRVWRRNLPAFVVISLLLYVPTKLALEAFTSELWAMFPLSLLTQALISAALTYGVVMELDNARPSFRDCVVRGLSQLPRVLVVVFLAVLVQLGGFMLLIVPGIIAMLMLYVVIPVAVIEHRPVVDVLRRSRQLTHGHKGDLFVILLVAAIVNGVIAYAIRQSATPDVAPLVGLALEPIATSFGAVLAAVSYTLLRRDAEGTTAPELAAAVARFAPASSPPSASA